MGPCFSLPSAEIYSPPLKNSVPGEGTKYTYTGKWSVNVIQLASNYNNQEDFSHLVLHLKMRRFLQTKWFDYFPIGNRVACPTIHLS